MKKEGKQMNNNAGTVAVTFGILAVLMAPGIFTLFLYGPFLGIAFSILAIAFGFSQKKSNKNKWATWGIILGIVGLVLNIIISVSLLAVIGEFLKQYANLQESGGLEALAQQGTYN